MTVRLNQRVPVIEYKTGFSENWINMYVVFYRLEDFLHRTFNDFNRVLFCVFY